MKQLRHFGIKTDMHGRSKDFTGKEFKDLARWEAEDEEHLETHCHDCDGPKTNRGVDLCYNCGKKKAASMGHKLTHEEYERG